MSTNQKTKFSARVKKKKTEKLCNEPECFPGKQKPNNHKNNIYLLPIPKVGLGLYLGGSPVVVAVAYTAR